MAKAKNNHPTPATVREWGRSEGRDFPGTAANTRGRLNPALVAAFNEGRKPSEQYVAGGAPEHTVERTVKVEDKTGRARPRKVSVRPSDAREYALAQGIAVGKQGRLPDSVLDAYALSTLNA